MVSLVGVHTTLPMNVDIREKLSVMHLSSSLSSTSIKHPMHSITIAQDRLSYRDGMGDARIAYSLILKQLSWLVGSSFHMIADFDLSSHMFLAST